MTPTLPAAGSALASATTALAVLVTLADEEKVAADDALAEIVADAESGDGVAPGVSDGDAPVDRVALAVDDSDGGTDTLRAALGDFDGDAPSESVAVLEDEIVAAAVPLAVAAALTDSDAPSETDSVGCAVCDSDVLTVAVAEVDGV